MSHHWHCLMRRFPPEKRTDKAEVAPTTERHSQLWWRLTIVVVLLGMVLAMLTENGHGSQPSRPHATLTAARAASAVKPKPAGELDCNGYSPIQHPVKPVGTLCAEVHSAGGQLYDNGYYIGHDEPTIRVLLDPAGFIDRRHLAADLAARPTQFADSQGAAHGHHALLRIDAGTVVLNGPLRPEVLSLAPLQAGQRYQHASWQLPGRWRGLSRTAVLPARVSPVCRRPQL